MNITKKTVELPIMEEVMTQTGVQKVEVWEVDGKQFYSKEQAEDHIWEKSVKRKFVSFPWNSSKVFLQNKDDYVRFEKLHISNYYTTKKYDEDKLEFPNNYVLYYEQNIDDGEDALLITYDEFRKMIIEELDRVKE